jgi:hypothetical protein
MVEKNRTGHAPLALQGVQKDTTPLDAVMEPLHLILAGQHSVQNPPFKKFSLTIQTMIQSNNPNNEQVHSLLLLPGRTDPSGLLPGKHHQRCHTMQDLQCHIMQANPGLDSFLFFLHSSNCSLALGMAHYL